MSRCTYMYSPKKKQQTKSLKKHLRCIAEKQRNKMSALHLVKCLEKIEFAYLEGKGKVVLFTKILIHMFRASFCSQGKAIVDVPRVSLRCASFLLISFFLTVLGFKLCVP